MTKEEDLRINKLMIEISNGDMEACGNLYQEFSKVFFNFIYKKVKNVQAAEDLTHNLFMKIAKGDFRHIAFENGVAYIFTCAKNLCRAYSRRNETRDKYKDKIYIKNGYVDEYTTLALDDLFKGLTDTEKRLVFLRYNYGCEVKEIAKILNIPERTLNRKFKEINLQIEANMKT